jgi:ATP-dependent DNA helicase RecQ
LTALQDTLKQYWGFTSFRPFQEEIIKAVIEGNDGLALMPTGGGKSLTYQLPGLVMDGICLVVTPLIALMNDQVEALKLKGIKAIALHSGQDKREIDFLLDSCIYGKVKFLYCSPERLQTSLFQERLRQMNVNLLAVDEAHCISQWGHDFRPSYLQIASTRALIPDVPLLAVTATATEKVQEEILQLLEMPKAQVFRQSFYRSNLSFSVRQVEDKFGKLLEILNKINGSTIIYVKTRRQAQQTAERLQRQAISSVFYHAGLAADQRQEAQKKWLAGAERVIVATNAFGMGIDKPDVRLVIHLAPPNSLEAYYQEAGRAGRDGQKAFAVLLVDQNDKKLLEEQLKLSHPSVDQLKHVYQCLANYYKLATGSGEGVSYQFSLVDFSRQYKLDGLSVFHALKRLSEDGLLKYTDNIFESSRVNLIVDHDDLYKFQIANAHFDPFIKALLRLYGGPLYNEFIKIKEHKLAEFMECSVAEVKKDLKALDQMEILNYVEAIDGGQITYLLPRQNASMLAMDYKRLTRLKEVDTAKVEAVIKYYNNQDVCRMSVLLSYFNETFDTCGICDVCLAQKHLIKDDELIISILSKVEQLNIGVADLLAQFASHHQEQVLDNLRKLLDAGQLRINEKEILEKS